jgi:hypothetical protein
MKKPKHQGYLPVDASRLNQGNSYSLPPRFYTDRPFSCVDCGIAEVWSAEDQKWWYEEIGAYFFSTAIRCRTCRAAERERKQKARERAGHAPTEDDGAGRGETPDT